jgi:hypothetical protein
MKLKYLDKNNCFALLPRHKGVPIEKELDNYLDFTNASGSGRRGIIDELIRYNKRTVGCDKRFFRADYPMSINLIITFVKNSKKVQSLCQTMDMPADRPIVFSLQLHYENGLVWDVKTPLQYLLKGWGDACDGYQCYSHVIAQNVKPAVFTKTPYGVIDKYPSMSDYENIKEYYYFGITGRNWLLRLKEHLYEVRRGSGKKFHNMWRENLGSDDVVYCSVLMLVNQSKDAAMDWEEEIIDENDVVGGSHGLNMIPGGYKGLRFLHELGLTARENITLSERTKAIAEYSRRVKSVGDRSMKLKVFWQDQNFYEHFIEAHPQKLTATQVRQIRKLDSEGMTADRIVLEVGARNERQVKDVLSGKYYKKVT